MQLKYSTHTFHSRYFHDITINGILLVQNATGDKVLLEITQRGYRELHCE